MKHRPEQDAATRVIIIPAAIGGLIATSLQVITASAAEIAEPDAIALPMNYLDGFGLRTAPVVPLTWAVFIISIAVVLIVTSFVFFGILLRRNPASVSKNVPIRTGSRGLSWIYTGLGLTMIPLTGILVWTMVVLAKVSVPPAGPAVTIEITGHQWWWEARYMSDDPAGVFTTANEIHIPAGQTVRLRLKSADVIHSFWVPSLAGKMQAIPGQTNELWIEAERPGRYRGQCTQFCGEQHAQMVFFVVADERAVFEAWRAHQVTPAPLTPQVAAAEQMFVNRCGFCHGVRGTDAGGVVAPNLSHLMTRQTLAAGSLKNSHGNLTLWIDDPQAIKPGVKMPDLYLSGQALQDVASYLETLN